MKKQLLSLVMMLLPMVASAYDFSAENADGVTIYYNYINNGSELEVTYISDSYYENSYRDVVVIPEEVTYMTRTRKVTSIGKYAFRLCWRVTDVTIPNSITSIGLAAFSGCRGLKSIVVPNSVTIIGDAAFDGCDELSSITLGINVTSIGYQSFRDCISLTSITIPNSVTSIGQGAFKNCKGLSTIIIPSNVVSIGKEAFYGWDMTEVFSNIENPFKIFTDTFTDNTFYNATLYVPKGSLNKYRSTEGWKKFAFIKEGTGGGTPDTQKCEKPTISYSSGNLTFASATDGVEFVSTISDADIASYTTSTIQLGITYNISVYATKSGYDNSDVATATLCWIDSEPKTEGITDGVAQIPSKAVLIQSEGGIVKVEGIDDGTPVAIYTTDGKQAGSAVSHNGAALVGTNIQAGNTAIVKIGDKSVKVMIK